MPLCVSGPCVSVSGCAQLLPPGRDLGGGAPMVPPGKGIPSHPMGQMRNGEAARGISDSNSQSREKQSHRSHKPLSSRHSGDNPSEPHLWRLGRFEARTSLPSHLGRAHPSLLPSPAPSPLPVLFHPLLLLLGVIWVHSLCCRPWSIPGELEIALPGISAAAARMCPSVPGAPAGQTRPPPAPGLGSCPWAAGKASPLWAGGSESKEQQGDARGDSPAPRTEQWAGTTDSSQAGDIFQKKPPKSGAVMFPRGA